LPIGRVAGGKITDDGQYLLLQTVQSDGQDIILALQREQLMPLVDMAALGFAQSNKALNVPSEQMAAFDVSWWEIGFDKATQRAVLSLTFGAGGRLDFLLAKGMPEQLFETLQAHVGQTLAEKPNKPLN